jgi:RimJ/RimL family protein N-acetyltransferase
MPPLDTARLTIRPWTLAAADVAAAFAVFRDEEVTRFLSRREPDLASQRGLGPLGLPRVVALVDRDNARWLVVVERLGLRAAGEAGRRGRTCLVFAGENEAPQPPGASAGGSAGSSAGGSAGDGSSR